MELRNRRCKQLCNKESFHKQELQKTSPEPLF